MKIKVKEAKVGKPETMKFSTMDMFQISILLKQDAYMLMLSAGSKWIDLEGATREAESIAKVLNTHDLLVAILECGIALDRQEEVAATFEKHGWTPNKPRLTPSLFLGNLRVKALEALNK